MFLRILIELRNRVIGNSANDVTYIVRLKSDLEGIIFSDFVFGLGGLEGNGLGLCLSYSQGMKSTIFLSVSKHLF